MTKRPNPKQNNNIGKIFLLVFLVGMLLIVAGGATFVGVKSEGFKNFDFITNATKNAGNTTETNTFSLRMNGEEFSSVNILSAEEIRIDVANGGNFTVAVAPISDVDFDFLLDGTLHQFATADGDYNRAFDVQVNAEDGYFVLHKQENVANVLAAAYADHEISDINCDVTGPLFEVIVTAENGEAKTFTIAGIVGDVMTVEIEPTEIVF